MGEKQYNPTEIESSGSFERIWAFVKLQYLKWGALSSKRSVLKKNRILTPFNVKTASNYTFLFLNKENEILLGPPPPQKKKAPGYERSRYGYTENSYEYTQCTGGLLGIAQCVYWQLHPQVFVYTSKQSVTWYSLDRAIRYCTITREQK